MDDRERDRITFDTLEKSIMIRTEPRAAILLQNIDTVCTGFGIPSFDLYVMKRFGEVKKVGGHGEVIYVEDDIGLALIKGGCDEI